MGVQGRTEGTYRRGSGCSGSFCGGRRGTLLQPVSASLFLHLGAPPWADGVSVRRFGQAAEQVTLAIDHHLETEKKVDVSLLLKPLTDGVSELCFSSLRVQSWGQRCADTGGVLMLRTLEATVVKKRDGGDLLPAQTSTWWSLPILRRRWEPGALQSSEHSIRVLVLGNHKLKLSDLCARSHGASPDADGET